MTWVSRAARWIPALPYAPGLDFVFCPGSLRLLTGPSIGYQGLSVPTPDAEPFVWQW